MQHSGTTLSFSQFIPHLSPVKDRDFATSHVVFQVLPAFSNVLSILLKVSSFLQTLAKANADIEIPLFSWSRNKFFHIEIENELCDVTNAFLVIQKSVNRFEYSDDWSRRS